MKTFSKLRSVFKNSHETDLIGQIGVPVPLQLCYANAKSQGKLKRIRCLSKPEGQASTKFQQNDWKLDSSKKLLCLIATHKSLGVGNISMYPFTRLLQENLL